MLLDIKKSLLDPAKALTFTEHFVDGYLSPAFGARSKSEVDLLVFTALIKAGAIDPGAAIYDLARTLNITPTRVRALLFNWQLRDPRWRNDLSSPLCEALQKTRFSKDGTLLTFGIESPLLKEEIVARLKSKGVFTDTSFSRDIVRMPVNAFVEFLDELIDPEVKKTFIARLVQDKQLEDKSFKAIAANVLGKLGEKIAGEVGKEIAADAVGAGLPVVKAFLLGLLSNRGEDAAKAAAEALGEA